MNYKKILLIVLLIGSIFLIYSCSDQKDNYENQNESERDIDYQDDRNDNHTFEDGTYSADVDYYNPETGYSSTYTLEVEIEDNQVVRIDFPNDGYLDESHIPETELDEDGSCQIIDDEEREFEIRIR